MSSHEPVDPPVALEALRNHLGMYANVPLIEHIHIPNPVMVDTSDRTIALCIHDAANECCHRVWFPAPNGPQDLVDGDGEIRAEVQVHCESYLCAAYN